MVHFAGVTKEECCLMPNILDTLITDRTQADVDYVARLNALGELRMTAQELADWRTDLKGAYNASDLNRVGQAVAYVAALLNSYGYAADVTPLKTWQGGDTPDIPTVAEMQTYLANVRAVREALTVPLDMPQLPASMDGLTYEGANAIEQVLLIVDELLMRMAASFVYCGQPYCGQIWRDFTT